MYLKLISLPPLTLTAAGLAFAVMMGGIVPASAMMEEPAPKPKINCSKKANKDRPECKKTQNSETLSDDELYYKGYWLAKAGQYSEALDQLRLVKNQYDPRVLNYIGFATRKLGNVDEALGYYYKALAINPNFTLARSYLGEALLQKGDLANAQAQLAEIEKRCGRTCKEFTELTRHIETFKSTGAHKDTKQIGEVKS